MKTTNALVAAALTSVFAAGSTVSQASRLPDGPVAAEREKDNALIQDNNLCQGKEAKETTAINDKVIEGFLPNDKGMGKGKKKDKDEEDKGS
ncbi:MAG: hypothetical protein ACRDBP_00075 [Luteolibacter sp.]